MTFVVLPLAAQNSQQEPAWLANDRAVLAKESYVQPPPEIVKHLSDEIARFAARPDIKERLLQSGVELDYAGTEDFSAFLKVEEVHWTDMAKAAGIKPQ